MIKFPLSVLPELIILTLNMINKIEEKKLKIAIKNKPEIIRNDMLKLEGEIFYNNIKAYKITLDATSLWLEDLFNNANKNNITDIEKYSSRAHKNIFRTGLSHLIAANTIDRKNLPDTLFLDYDRIKKLQLSQYKLIIKLITHETIKQIQLQNNISIDQTTTTSIINGSCAHININLNQYINTVATLIKNALPSTTNDQTKQTVFNQIVQLLNKHCIPSHRLYQLLLKRTTYIINKKINTGVLDTHILKCDNPNFLDDFNSSFGNSFTRLINNHLKTHTQTYKQELRLLQAQEFINKITHQYFLPNTVLPPHIKQTKKYIHLSLSLNKIALISTCMSMTVQFINAQKNHTNTTVTAEDIAQHIKETRADILFKRQNYTHAQIVDHIIEYRKMPLLNKQNINLQTLFKLLLKTELITQINKININHTTLTALFIIGINQLNNHKDISLLPKQLISLSNHIKSIKPHRHPGFKIYQAACRRILLEYCAHNSFNLRHKRKWAALSLFREPLLQLALSTKLLLSEIYTEANTQDQQSTSSKIPQHLKTGFK